MDEESQTLAKQLVSEITVAEHRLRAWSKSERGNYASATAKLPAMLKNQPYGKIMAAVTKLNNLPAEGFVRIRAMSVSSGSGRRRSSWRPCTRLKL